jgi:hypothetical protein
MNKQMADVLPDFDFRRGFEAQNTPFSVRNHPNVGGKTIVFSPICQWIEPIGMLVGPGKPVIGVAS